MIPGRSFSPEWERIDLLGACLSASRQGLEVTDEISERLRAVQQQVQKQRLEPPWKGLINENNLEPIDLDILACTIAPVAEPRIGWMYQQLQPGIQSAYPTPALIRELFVLNSEESSLFSQRLQSNSSLMQTGMIAGDAENPYQPLQPTAHARSEFLGWQEPVSLNIPGAVQVPSPATWKDLVIPEQTARNLQEFMLWVEHRQQVEDWGARIQGGPVALFSGPSGTGKTYAAEVVANALGRPLYRVDLGLLVSKYVGETEKNLNTLFDAAHKAAIVLLFDEADALFGQRGEVKDARDRYANMEVSHLLSRIERHQGPCILTSNLHQHIDQAFLRRFQIVIHFSRPDAAARAQIWHKHIPAQAPIDPQIDLELLGKACELTGGQIRNAALHAAFLAAGSSTPISPAHIASAVWTELSKSSDELSTSSLGCFAQHLPAGVA